MRTKVLVNIRSAITQKVVGLTLKASTYECVFSQMDESLKLLDTQGPFDLIILEVDSEYSDKDHFSLKKMKDSLPHIKVLIITDTLNSEQKYTIKNDLFDDQISRLFEGRELLLTIAQLLERKDRTPANTGISVSSSIPTDPILEVKPQIKTKIKPELAKNQIKSGVKSENIDKKDNQDDKDDKDDYWNFDEEFESLEVESPINRSE